MSSTTGSSSSSSLSGASSSNSPSASSSMGSPGSSGSPLGPVVLSPVDGKESCEPGRSGRNIYRYMHYFWIFLVNINLSPWKFNCYGMKSYCLDKNFDLLDWSGQGTWSRISRNPLWYWNASNLHQMTDVALTWTMSTLSNASKLIDQTSNDPSFNANHFSLEGVTATFSWTYKTIAAW